MGLVEIALLVCVGFVIAKVIETGKDRSRDYTRHDSYLPPAQQEERQRNWTPPVVVERSETEEINYRSGTSTPPPQQQMIPPEIAREKKMTDLKRRYVADEITVEEYEAELDKLMRPGSNG